MYPAYIGRLCVFPVVDISFLKAILKASAKGSHLSIPQTFGSPLAPQRTTQFIEEMASLVNMNQPIMGKITNHFIGKPAG